MVENIFKIYVVFVFLEAAQLAASEGPPPADDSTYVDYISQAIKVSNGPDLIKTDGWSHSIWIFFILEIYSIFTIT